MNINLEISALKNLEYLINAKRAIPLDISQYTLLSVEPNSNTSVTRNTKLVLRNTTSNKRLTLYYNRIDLNTVITGVYSSNQFYYNASEFIVNEENVKSFIKEKLFLHSDYFSVSLLNKGEDSYTVTITVNENDDTSQILYFNTLTIELSPYVPILPGFQYSNDDDQQD